MGTVILIPLIIGEIIFLFWALNAGSVRKREKYIWKMVCTVILALLLIIGVLEGVSRYGAILLVLLFQACMGLFAVYLLALLPAFLFPQYKPLPVTGDHAVEIAEYTYADENRMEHSALLTATTRPILSWLPMDML